MEPNQDIKELVFFDMLGAREAALGAAVGYLVTDNVPADRLQVIADSASDLLSLAARVALYRRG